MKNSILLLVILVVIFPSCKKTADKLILGEWYFDKMTITEGVTKKDSILSSTYEAYSTSNSGSVIFDKQTYHANYSYAYQMIAKIIKTGEKVTYLDTLQSLLTQAYVIDASKQQISLVSNNASLVMDYQLTANSLRLTYVGKNTFYDDSLHLIEDQHRVNYYFVR